MTPCPRMRVICLNYNTQLKGIPCKTLVGEPKEKWESHEEHCVCPEERHKLYKHEFIECVVEFKLILRIIPKILLATGE